MPAAPSPRGPDFLPYPLPQARFVPAGADEPAPRPEPGGRRRRFPAEKVLAGVAVLALAGLSLALGERLLGAVIATAAATAGVTVAVRRRLVQASELVGSAAAVAALLLLLFIGSSPTPTESAAPQVLLTAPSPTAPTSPDPFELPPAATAIPGVPSQPDPPLASATTATGLLTGRVLDRSGQPVSGASVVVSRARPGDVSDAPRCPLRVRTTTDATGSYRLSLCQLADGLAYTVRISVGGATAQATVYVNAGRTTVYTVILDLRRA